MKFFFLFLFCFFYALGSIFSQAKVNPSSKELISSQKNVKITSKTFSGEIKTVTPPTKANLTATPKSFGKIQAKKVANTNPSSINSPSKVSSHITDVNYLHEYIKTTEALIDKLKDKGLDNSDKSLLKAESALENAKLKLAFLNN